MNPRRLAIALAVSVGLNLFFGGFVVARKMFRPHHGQREHHMGPPPMAGPAGMFRDFDDPKLHKHMKKVFDGRREHLDHDRAQIRDARRKVAEALERQPPDSAELEAAFAGLRTATTEAQAELHRSLIELAPTLSIEQRQQLIRKWTKGRRD